MVILLLAKEMGLVFLAQIKNSQKGFALLEILLALSLSVIIVVSIVSLGIYTVRGLSDSRVYFEAGKIAQRELDRLKILREANGWTREDGKGFYDLVRSCSSSCYIKVNAGALEVVNGVGVQSNLGSTISYYFQIREINDRSLNYTVFANWVIRGVPKTYKIEGRLTNWSWM